MNDVYALIVGLAILMSCGSTASEPKQGLELMAHRSSIVAIVEIHSGIEKLENDRIEYSATLLEIVKGGPSIGRELQFVSSESLVIGGGALVFLGRGLPDGEEVSGVLGGVRGVPAQYESIAAYAIDARALELYGESYLRVRAETIGEILPRSDEELIAKEVRYPATGIIGARDLANFQSNITTDYLVELDSMLVIIRSYLAK